MSFATLMSPKFEFCPPRLSHPTYGNVFFIFFVIFDNLWEKEEKMKGNQARWHGLYRYTGKPEAKD